MTAINYAVVVPTLGRPSLSTCLAALAGSAGPRPARVVLVDDRPLDDCEPLPVVVPAALADRISVVPGAGNGPAAARNAGWRNAPEPWIAFLDDDTVPGPTWAADLVADLTAAGPRTAGVQGRIVVPTPDDRPPTDWERTTAALATARWITADLAYRRVALAEVGGFDERFRRAFREDADIALRLIDQGWELTTGRRTTAHPVRPADPWISLRLQVGNADDVLMTRLHGRDWWQRAGAPRGRLPRHLAVTGAAAAALTAGLVRRPGAAAALAAAWLLGTAEFAVARIAPGPRTAAEIRAMLATSVLIPPAAAWHWARGRLRHRNAPAWTGVAAPTAWPAAYPLPPAAPSAAPEPADAAVPESPGRAPGNSGR
ncbi:glycosyltransferase [Kitasatospora sp. RB6PN24]|uniref:glycosyltransferase family 2 protein n=1 Tax=Kitasatospora humi TaxID=2893891 RepID=UPI001E54B219|nr:glycosyltransferase [Kitasatospora humi]MCC9305904.1 glycosyltransferase [Kitasatospora humi]